ncbi:CBR-VAB-1 protein [Aphelenchoides avenae]|nr:CBR-VAB-1 protein [Aphelenchus avenae]
MTANQTSVTLGWQEPSSLGGRKEIWYSYKCPQCPHTVVADPPRKYFEAPYLVLANLEPGTRYTLMIFALNDVSSLSDMKQYEVVEFKTEDSDNVGLSGVRVDAETENGVTIAWDSLSGVTDYELEKWEQNMTTMNVRTDQPYYSFGALDSRRIYGFRVRAWSRRQSVTSWSDPLFYQVGTGQVSKEVASRAGLFIGRSVATSAEGIGGGRSNHTKWDGDMSWQVMLAVLFVAILLCGIFWLVYRRVRASRKQMSDCDVLDSDYTKDTIVDYGQYPNCGLFRNKMHGPLITNTQHQYGTQRLANAAARNAMMREKEYVDPATYQDPTQAVSEFAREIPPGSVVTSQPLDSGEFGEVFYGRFVTEDAYGRPMEALVAVKTLKADQQHNKNDFLMEAARMGQFNNRNVIRLIGVVTQSDPVMIVTELMVNKSLDKYLRDNQEQIGLTQVVRMIKGIANGMCYLHSKNFIHRDLAARNVLVNDKLECKISDFGLSRQLRLDDVYGTEPIYNTRGGKVPIRWTAPEALSQNTYTKASDVWSFGIVMWECTTFGERPYWEWENQVVIQQVTNGYRLPCPNLLGDNAHPLYRLMQQCWQVERTIRPTFVQLYADLQALELQLTAEDCGIVRVTNLHGGVLRWLHDTDHLLPPAIATSVSTAGASLQDFLEHNGIGHCFTNLNARGIGTVVRLMQYSYSDLRSLGLREEDANRICDALRLHGFAAGSSDEAARTTRPRFQRPPPLPPMPYFPPVTLRRQQALSSLPPTPGGLVSSSGVSSGSSAGTGRGNQRSPLLSTSSVGTTQTILTSATPSGSCNAMMRRSMNLSTEEGFFV